MQMDDPRQYGVSVSCVVRIYETDEWRELHSESIKEGTSFVTYLPDLQNISETTLKEPSGNIDAKKRLESEETRINNPSEMMDL